jgi:hypothetical protein
MCKVVLDSCSFHQQIKLILVFLSSVGSIGFDHCLSYERGLVSANNRKLI